MASGVLYDKLHVGEFQRELPKKLGRQQDQSILCWSIGTQQNYQNGCEPRICIMLFVMSYLLWHQGTDLSFEKALHM